MKRAVEIWCIAAWLVLSAAAAQDEPQVSEPQLAQLAESGQISVNGRPVPYLIHRLPVSSFPQLPNKIAAELVAEGCMIPQTYEAHRPENVVHGSLQRAGSSDWAVLCAAKGWVSLLVFFGSDPGKSIQLASVPETEKLRPHDPSGVMGFDWGIDVATPEQVREAQAGMDHLPPPVDHDALADSVIDWRTTYHYYAGGMWTLLDMPLD